MALPENWVHQKGVLFECRTKLDFLCWAKAQLSLELLEARWLNVTNLHGARFTLSKLGKMEGWATRIGTRQRNSHSSCDWHWEQSRVV